MDLCVCVFCWCSLTPHEPVCVCVCVGGGGGECGVRSCGRWYQVSQMAETMTLYFIWTTFVSSSFPYFTICSASYSQRRRVNVSIGC